MSNLEIEYKNSTITHSIYYVLTPNFLRKLPIVFWGGISILAFGIATFLIQQFSENMSLETVAAFCSLFTLIPMSHIQDYQRFYQLIEKLIDLFKLDSKIQVNIYFKLNRIFSLKNPVMWMVSLTANMACTAILLYLGLPFKSTLLNVLAMIGFEVIVFFGGQSVYTTLADLNLLREFASISPRTGFLTTFPLRLQEFSTIYYLNSSFHILLIYVTLLLMVFRGPYPVSFILMALLVTVALLPTTYILYFVYQIHMIMISIKQKNLETLDRKIGDYWKTHFEKADLSNEETECLGKLLELRMKIQHMSEWPWDIPGSIGFFISTSISITQTIFAILKS